MSGNVEFPASVEVVAHTNARRLMEEWNPVTGFPGDFPDVFDQSGGQGLPTRTYDDRLTLGSGDDQVDLHYFGRGHTGGDTWVVFPALRVMHAGDMFPGKQVPIMDASNGGSGVDYAQTLRNAHATVTGIDLIITGHATQMTPRDPSGDGRFRRGVRRRGARGEGGRAVGGGSGGELGDACTILGLQQPAGGTVASVRAGDLRRAGVAR